MIARIFALVFLFPMAVVPILAQQGNCHSGDGPTECSQAVRADYFVYNRSHIDNVLMRKAVAWWWSTKRELFADTPPTECGAGGHPPVACDSPNLSTPFGDRECTEDFLLPGCISVISAQTKYPYVEHLTGLAFGGAPIPVGPTDRCVVANNMFAGQLADCNNNPPILQEGQWFSAGWIRTKMLRGEHNGGAGWANLHFEMGWQPGAEDCEPALLEVQLWRRINNFASELIGTKKQWTPCTKSPGTTSSVGNQLFLLTPPVGSPLNIASRSVAYRVRFRVIHGAELTEVGTTYPVTVYPQGMQAMYRQFPVSSDYAQSTAGAGIIGYTFNAERSMTLATAEASHIFAFGEIDLTSKFISITPCERVLVDGTYRECFYPLHNVEQQNFEMRLELTGPVTRITEPFAFNQNSQGGRPLYLWVFDDVPPGTYTLRLQAKSLEDHWVFYDGVELSAFTVNAERVYLEKLNTASQSFINLSWSPAAQKIGGYFVPSGFGIENAAADYSNLGMVQYRPDDDREIVAVHMSRIPRDVNGNDLTCGNTLFGAPGCNDWGWRREELSFAKYKEVTLSFITE